MRKFWVVTSAEGPKFLELFEVIKSTCSWALYWPGDGFDLKVFRNILFSWDFHRFIETDIFLFCTKHFNVYKK